MIPWQIVTPCRRRLGRRRPLCTLLIVALSLLASATWWPVAAEPVAFSGRVLSLVTQQPVAGARVRAGGQEATADAQGRYTLRVPEGAYDLRVEAAGYVGMTETGRSFDGRRTATVDFALVPLAPTAEQRALLDEAFTPVQSQQGASDADPLTSGDLPLSALVVSAVPETLGVLMPDGSVANMAMDDYLRGVLANEVPPHWPPEVLRAQAIAARSYASTRRAHGDRGADVCTTTHCQVYSSTRYDTTDRAVSDTHGTVIRYQGAIASAYYHANCGGHTRNVEDVWSSYVPYLRGVACPLSGVARVGHGVGLCQYGARTMATQGAGFVEILKHYYSGVDVQGPAMMRVENATVTPASGDQSTLFTFQASYVGGSDAPPAVANVVIDGRAYALELVAWTEQGRTYRYQTHLTVGEHDYRFYFDDGHGQVVRVPGAGSLAGPSVSAGGAAPSPKAEAGTTAWSATHSTAADWAGGTFAGVEVTGAGDGALALAGGRTEGTYTSAIITSPFPYMAVGVSWYARQPDGASLSLELRRSADGQAWGEWRPIAVDEEMGAGPAASSELLFGDGVAFQYRATLRAGSGGASPTLEDLRVVCIDARNGPVAADLAPVRALANMPNVISRQAWGANEALMTSAPEYRTISAIVVHHTATDPGGVDPAAMVRAIYYYHAVSRGWGDIGYNYLIDVYGNVYEGRAGGPGVVGHHSGWYNYGSVGVSLIGNFQTSDVPAPMRASLTSVLAAQCSSNWLDPQGQGFFIDRVLPTIFAHRDISSTTCPGDRAYALMGSFRAEAKSKMGAQPPSVAIAAPRAGTALGGVVEVVAEASGAVSRVDFILDGVQRASVGQAPYVWRWNTGEVGDGVHTLRAVAVGSGGQSAASVEIAVDNTPPSGTATVPAWVRGPLVPLTLQSTESAAVQFSNGWIWEGEDLRHQVGTRVDDGLALNGAAWLGRPSDGAGFWYGPYTLALPPHTGYQVYYRLRTANLGGSATLARVDVADNQGNRVYAERTVSGRDFMGSNVYQEFRLDVAYQSTEATWYGVENGVEFRTWFEAAGDLALDRVAVYSAPRAYSSYQLWSVPAQEGEHVVTVRFIDAAGNVADTAVTVRLDMTPPVLEARAGRAISVSDARSGLDTYSARYTYSTDQGYSWSHWQSLPLTAQPGTRGVVRLEAPAAAGDHVRYQIKDLAGNVLDVAPAASAPQTRPTLLPGHRQSPVLPLIYRFR